MSFCNACCDFCRNPEQRRQAGLEKFAEKLEVILYKRADGNVESIPGLDIRNLNKERTLTDFLNRLKPGCSAYLRAIQPDGFIKVTCNDQGVFAFNSADGTHEIEGANIYLKKGDDPVFAKLLEKYGDQDEIKGRLVQGDSTLSEEYPLYYYGSSYDDKCKIVVGEFPEAYLIGVQNGKFKFIKRNDYEWMQNPGVAIEEAKLEEKILTREEKRQQEIAEEERDFTESLGRIMDQVRAKNTGEEPAFIQVSVSIYYGEPEVEPIDPQKTKDEITELRKSNDKTYVLIGDYLVCLQKSTASFIKRIDFQNTTDMDEANVRTVWLKAFYWNIPQRPALLWIGTSMHAARMIEALKIFANTFWPNYCTTAYTLPVLDYETKKHVQSMPEKVCGFAVFEYSKVEKFGIVLGYEDYRSQHLAKQLKCSTELSYKDSGKERIRDLLLVTSSVEFNDLTPIKSEEGTNFYLFCNDKAAAQWESGRFKFNSDEILSGCDAILYVKQDGFKEIICRSKMQGTFSTNIIYEQDGKKKERLSMTIGVNGDGNEAVNIATIPM